MLAQYLLALMGPGRAADPFSELLGGMFPGGIPGGGSPEGGRWGDYVFNQEGVLFSYALARLCLTYDWRHSSRSDNLSDYGEQQRTPACSSH